MEKIAFEVQYENLLAVLSSNNSRGVHCSQTKRKQANEDKTVQGNSEPKVQENRKTKRHPKVCTCAASGKTTSVDSRSKESFFLLPGRSEQLQYGEPILPAACVNVFSYPTSSSCFYYCCCKMDSWSR
ncbi:hypothetical protein CBL_07000 [Carabus blaptoides fortunei]